MVTEFYSHFGRIDDAVDQLEGAVATGLFDLNWAERCPALANLRADPRFATSRAVVADRAQTVRNALGI